jgi:hypothetical protein
MRKMLQKKISLYTLFFLVSLIFSACSPTAPQEEATDIALDGNNQAAAPAVNDTDSIVEETESIQADSENLDGQISGNFPTSGETLSKDELPTPKTSLVATNPDSVKLASGGVQFIEYFAYW